MPGPGAGQAEASLPPPGDSASWSEADWHWDPVAMKATALERPAAAANASAHVGAALSVPHGNACAATAGLDQYMYGLGQPEPAAGPASKAAGAVGAHEQPALPAGGSANASDATAPPAAAAGSTDGDSGGAVAAAVAAPVSTARGRAGRGSGGRKKGGAAPPAPPTCQADGCGADLSSHTYYHQRNKICSVHIKADVFLRDGQQLRFCQRCGHAHPLSEFDPGKHSCRKQLEKHNARRRKRQASAGGSAEAAAPKGQKQQRRQQQQQQGGEPGAQAAAAASAQRGRRGRGKPAASLAAPSDAAVAAFASADAGFAAAAGTRSGSQAPSELDTAGGGSYQPSSLQPSSLQPSFNPSMSGTSASASAEVRQSPGSSGAAGGGLATAGAGGLPAQLQQRPPSPAVPLLEFDFGEEALQPTPFEELFGQPGGEVAPAGSADLADHLADWLNTNLSHDQAQHAKQQQQQLQHVPPVLPPSQQPMQDGWQAGYGGGPTMGPAGSQGWYGAAASAPLVPQQQPDSLRYAQGVMQQSPLSLADPSLLGQTAAPLQYPHPSPLQHPSAYPAQPSHLLGVTLGVPVSAPLPPLMHAPAGHAHAGLSPHGMATSSAPLAAQQPLQQQHTLPPLPRQPPASLLQGGPAVMDTSPASTALGPASSGTQDGSRHSTGADGQGPPSLTTVSVKLFGCTPADLPTGLREHLRTWFDGAVHAMDGYLRPGCVHLTVQALLDGMLAAAEQRAAADGTEGDGERAEGRPEAAASAGDAQPASAAAAEGAAGREAPSKPCCQAPPAPAAAPAAEEPRRPQPAGPPAAAPAAATPAAAGACCGGRKRAAEGPAVPAGGSDSTVRRIVARMLQSGEALWRRKTMLVQAGSHVALVHQGRLHKTWDLEGGSSERAVPAILEVSPPVLLASRPEPLRISGLNMLQNDARLLLRLQGRYVAPTAATCADCACQASVESGSEGGPGGAANRSAAAVAAASFEQRCCGCCVSKLQLVGLLPRAASPAAPASAPQPEAAAPAAPAAKPSCCQGKAGAAGSTEQAQPEQAEQQAHQQQQQPSPAERRVAAGPARVQALRVHLPSQQGQQRGAGQAGQGPLPPGLLHLDIARHAFTAPRGARVLVVSSPAVHAELTQLLARQGPAALPQSVLDQLGIVHEWLGQPLKMQYALVEATAARLLFWATSAGLPATAGLLLSVLQAQDGSSAAAAAAVLQRALQPEAAGQAASAALSSLDGLSQLHLSMQATSAAAMQRAAELACRDGLSLLHRAVQSGSRPTLDAVLSWGEEAGSPWRCDLAGPLGLSPLHLAALLPSPSAARAAALLLMRRCAPGAAAWDCCCSADGQSPASFFRAAAGAAAAKALGAEVAALLQQQRGETAAAPLAKHAPGSMAAPAPLSLPPPAKQIQAAPVPAEQPQLPPLQKAQPKAAEAAPAGEASAAAAAALAAALAAAAGPEMQPDTPRRNPGCLCAPGCPCALLDRCACCESSDEEEQAGADGSDKGEAHHSHGTCGAGSGKCCCCSGAASLPGCAGCQAPRSPTLGPTPAAPPSCCGGKR